MNLGDLTRFLNPIKRQIFLLIGKAILTAVNNEGKTGFHDSGTRANPQRVSMNWFGQLTDIERTQPYGFETYPKADTAKCVIVSPDGSRSNAFVIMIQDDEYRPTDLAESDVCLYNKDDLRVWLEGTKLRIKGATGGVVVEDGDVTVEKGDAIVKLGNAIVEAGDAIIGPNSISFLNHFHLGNLGVNTGIPVVGGGTPGPASPATTNATGDIIDGSGKNLRTHTHPYTWTDAGGAGNTGAAN